jgi:hypothetical protein
MSVTVISVGAPAQVKAAASLCPEPVNTYLQAPHQIPGDLDLCQWSALSLKGPYVTVQPVQTITYTSCTAWKEAVADWNTAGRPPTSVPGGVGQTRTVLDPVPVVLGKDPAKRGYFRIQVAFQPATGTPNPSRTIVSRPTWPGITTAQQQQLDQIVARILVHEEGHQNLGGFAAAAYDKVISVPAKNQKQAQQVLSDPAFIQEVRDLDALADESRNHVHDVYDAVTVHGRQQSSLGGIDISAFNCGTIDFTYSRLAAHASTGLVPCQLEPGTTGTFPSLLVKGTLERGNDIRTAARHLHGSGRVEQHLGLQSRCGMYGSGDQPDGRRPRFSCGFWRGTHRTEVSAGAFQHFESVHRHNPSDDQRGVGEDDRDIRRYRRALDRSREHHRFGGGDGHGTTD